MRTVYLNGAYIPENEATVSPFDRGFLFSDAVYEVVSVIDGRLIDFERHMVRLSRSLDEMYLADNIRAKDWRAIFRRLVDENSLREGLIYLQISRGNAGDRSFYWPAPETDQTVFVFTQPLELMDPPMAKAGMSIVTLPDLRWGRADIKTTQLVYASMMKMEAKAKGADDAWLVRDDVVTEGTSQNAHIITHDNVLVTHPLNRTVLHGVTRASMLELLADQNLELEQRAFTVEEAEQAKEAFVSSASTFVMPVTQINGKKIGDGKPGTVSLLLRKAYIAWAKANAA